MDCIARKKSVEVKVEGVLHKKLKLEVEVEVIIISRYQLCIMIDVNFFTTQESTTPIFGFKEWALVCEALGSGEQSLLLRKGGIAEGKKGFGFEHNDFFLFPTWFHGQLEKMRSEHVPAAIAENPETVTLEYVAHVDWSGFVSDRKKLARLEKLHVLHDSVIDERFSYNAAKASEGLHVAFVRVYRMSPTIELPMEKRFGGCRSWVQLPMLTSPGTLISIVSDEEHAERKSFLEEVLSI